MDVRTIERPEECEGRLSAMLFDLWLDLKEGAVAPLAPDFDYFDRPKLVPHLIILQTCAGSSDFTVTFTGSEVIRLFGKDDMTHMVSELLGPDTGGAQWAEYNANTQVIIDLCRKEIKPVLNGPGLLSFVPDHYLRFESLTVPFVDVAGALSQTISVFDLFGQNIDLARTTADQMRAGGFGGRHMS